MREIYLQSTNNHNSIRVACDEDMRYWIFDDSCEPVGLTCEDKSQWSEISEEAYRRIQACTRRASSVSDDVIEGYLNAQLLNRGKALAYGADGVNKQ
jgi:hypothetical protein